MKDMRALKEHTIETERTVSGFEQTQTGQEADRKNPDISGTLAADRKNPDISGTLTADRRSQSISETWAEETIADLDDFIESQGIYIRQ